MTNVVVTSQPDTDLHQVITTGAHKWVCDATRDEGGSGISPDPHQYLLGALGACTAMTLQIYAQRRGWQLEAVEIELSEAQVPDPQEPGKHMSAITRDIHVTGDLTEDQLHTLRTIADKCPIHKLLTGHKSVATSLSLQADHAVA